MYCVTAIRKVIKNVPDAKYSNGMDVKDDTLQIMLRNDSALREIVTGLIHEGCTVTIEPDVYVDEGMKPKRAIPDNAPSDVGYTHSLTARG